MKEANENAELLFTHDPVMAVEVAELLVTDANGIYIDGTLGAGGHALAILKRLGNKGRLIGIDRDEQALAGAKSRLAEWRNQISFVHGNFAETALILAEQKIESLDGVLLDLGVSSMQIDDALRGFSFMKDGPLDMRMDKTQNFSAAELIESMSAEELKELIFSFGEERDAKRIANAIVKERVKKKFVTTAQLAELVYRIKGGRRSATHPATRTFQALRISVNRELENLNEALEQSILLLKVGGRMAVISYHSLEDRMVKHFFRKHVGAFESLAEGGRRRTGAYPEARWVHKKPIIAAPDEIKRNPRSRSAKLRVIERTA